MKKRKYSIPIYENGKLTGYTIDCVEGDNKWKALMEIHKQIPTVVNVGVKLN